jgi:hypothetical protein
MADYKYTDSTPVDEPVAKQKPAPKKEAEAKAKMPKEPKQPEPVLYTDSAPVDEPVSPPIPKKFAKGGSASSRADGIAQRGKTKGKCL